MKNYTTVLPILSAVHSASLLPNGMGTILPAYGGTGVPFVTNLSPDLPVVQ